MDRPPSRTPGIVALPGGGMGPDAEPLPSADVARRAILARRIVDLGSPARRSAARAALEGTPAELASLCLLALREVASEAAHRTAILDVLTRRPVAEALAAVDGDPVRWAELLAPAEWVARAAWFVDLDGRREGTSAAARDDSENQ